MSAEPVYHKKTTTVYTAWLFSKEANCNIYIKQIIRFHLLNEASNLICCYEKRNYLSHFGKLDPVGLTEAKNVDHFAKKCSPGLSDSGACISFCKEHLISHKGSKKNIFLACT